MYNCIKMLLDECTIPEFKYNYCMTVEENRQFSLEIQQLKKEMSLKYIAINWLFLNEN